VLRSDGAGAGVAHIAHRERMLRMDGRVAGRAMLARLPHAICETLNAAHIGVEDVDLFVPQDSNARLTRQLMDAIGLEHDRLASELECLGNTATATLPIALASAAARGRLHAGDTVLLAAFGAGYAWGSLVWRW
jgi:3-oxoacyl-[acyl-carrier-protein] synthase III